MANVNKVIQIGRLTRDPETKVFGSGSRKTYFGFATNNRKKNQSTGQWEDDPCFTECELWDPAANEGRAKLAFERLKKGSQIYIEGFLKGESWTDKGGQKRYVNKIGIINFQFLDPKPTTPNETPATSGEESPGEQAPEYAGAGVADDIPF